ncbi:hypothetical protein TraAM80_00400 [Trypanosoma rangeli]|uniref:TLC domain-containing protein n=1 Tax=Trypanosoma rangeli TaxID=5698 RepID=A0A3R7LDI3_TRYRA|nr:uncharacterized protein TraAM80_00400 [Trypanosoma rangeli]RNF12253.1 hypothetical protein TraAM80_00400 [Trypanosoma rangeli]|eukprot:RNF12253.1 hypothetical protein TraAM80_00400 [Trypanosoma rangeli]
MEPQHNVVESNYKADVACCNDVGGLFVSQRLLYIGLAFFLFVVFFVIAWSVLKKYYPRFMCMSVQIQCDVSSRIISALHTIIVVPSLIGGVVSMKWGDHFEPLSDVSFLQGLFCISLGYFLYDTIILLLYRQPNWIGFIVHHAVSSIPYVIYLFAGSCPYGLFILACFMLVEATNISLHIRSTLEENGRCSTKLYTVALYSTCILWIVFRLINPTALLIITHKYILPSLPPRHASCLIPSLICAYVINFFCYAVFIMLCKEVLTHHGKLPHMGGVVSIDSIQVGEQCLSCTTAYDHDAMELRQLHHCIYGDYEVLLEHLPTSELKVDGKAAEPMKINANEAPPTSSLRNGGKKDSK